MQTFAITAFQDGAPRRAEAPVSEEVPPTISVNGRELATPASPQEILILREDIGRHNAIDKVVGEALYRGIAFSERMLLTSGRISSEILSKALRCRMPVIVAAGAAA